MNKGAALKDLIRNSKFSQRYIAQQLDVNESYISLQLRNPNLADDFIKNVCDILNMDMTEHFIEENTPTTNYKSKYEKLKETYLNEKAEWLNKAERLLAENHALKEEILELRGK